MALKTALNLRLWQREKRRFIGMKNQPLFSIEKAESWYTLEMRLTDSSIPFTVKDGVEAAFMTPYSKLKGSVQKRCKIYCGILEAARALPMLHFKI
jgi:hypothetical protein